MTEITPMYKELMRLKKAWLIHKAEQMKLFTGGRKKDIAERIVEKQLDVQKKKLKRKEVTGNDRNNTKYCIYYLSGSGGNTIEAPRALFRQVNGRRVPEGGTGPSIEETELFLFQAARGAVDYEPHPVWGDKVLCPVKVPGLSDQRLKELNPFTTRSLDEMRRLLHSQIHTSKYYLDTQCAGLDENIRDAMDF